MARPAAVIFLVLGFTAACPAQTSLIRAATGFVPGVRWKTKSVVVADFTCEGHKQQAILGIDAKDLMIVAIFLHGLNTKPEVLTLTRYPNSVRLEADDLDYDPRKDLGYELHGFRRSKVCMGLAVIDDETDAGHLYRDHVAHEFGSWSN